MEKIIYGFYPSSLGEMVLGKTEKGLCWLGFMVAGYGVAAVVGRYSAR